MRALFLFVLLAGCASPSEIRSTDERPLSYVTAMTPKQAALCLVKAAEEYRPDLQTLVREHPDHYEVRVTNIYAIMVVGEVRENESGSTVTLWQPPTLTWVRDAMVDGCR